MSTNAHVGIEHDDGSIEYIYTHWDGNIDSLGLILMAFYESREKLQPLIDLGDCSSVSNSISSTVAYHRDRNESRKATLAINVESREEFLNDDEEYLYMLTKDGQWLVDGGGYNCTLAEAIDEVCDL